MITGLRAAIFLGVWHLSSDPSGEGGVKTKFPQVEDHACCYADCPEEGTVHCGPNGGDSHWICFRHLERWNRNRARFLADGGGCDAGTWRTAEAR